MGLFCFVRLGIGKAGSDGPIVTRCTHAVNGGPEGNRTPEAKMSDPASSPDPAHPFNLT